MKAKIKNVNVNAFLPLIQKEFMMINALAAQPVGSFLSVCDLRETGCNEFH